MAIFKLPIRNDLPAYDFSIDLDGVNYTLSFRYNSRMSLWIMDIKDSEQNNLKMGIPIQTEVDLISTLKKEGFPDGTFLAIHETGLKIDADREAFGNTIDLYYEEASE